MDFRKLHEPYKDHEAPTPEFQVKWLKRLGFQDNTIDRAMIAVYTEIEQKTLTFKNGAEFNIFLKNTARVIESKDLSAYINRLEEFEAKLRKKWEERLPWWKRWLGIKK